VVDPDLDLAAAPAGQGQGVAGQGPADLQGVEAVILRLSRLALDLEDRVAEVDINPLLVKEDGVFVVDALVHLKP
jgi:succinyl-CoA synthetase beta subunit